MLFEIKVLNMVFSISAIIMQATKIIKYNLHVKKFRNIQRPWFPKVCFYPNTLKLSTGKLWLIFK